MKKISIFISLLLTPFISKAATQIYIPSTSTFHNYTINVGSGTIRNFNASTFTVSNLFITSETVSRAFISSLTVSNLNSTGTFTFTGSTATHSNSVQGGTLFNIATTTFNNGTFSGTRNDNSTVTFSNGRYSGLRNDNSTTTYNNATFNGVVLHNSSDTYTSVQLFSTGTVNGQWITSTLGVGPQSPPSFNSSARNIVISSLGSSAGMTIDQAANGSGFLGFTDAVGTTLQGLITYNHNATAANENFTFRVASVDDLLLIKTSGVSMVGTNTNDNATTGYVGEYISSTTVAIATFPATGTYGTLLAITLTAGDWDITLVEYSNANGATVTDVSFGISTVAGTSTSGLVSGVNQIDTDPGPVSGTSNQNGCIPNYRQSISATTTYYFKLRATYSVATPKAGGTIFARRMR